MIQSVAEADETKQQTRQMKALKNIQNNRYLNQTIYLLFIQGKFDQCMSMIQKCKPDEYKYYMKSLIYQQEFQLDQALEMLTECQILNRTNFTYMKDIAKVFFLLGKYKSSLQVAKEAYKLNSSEYEIMYIFGKISTAMNDIDGAITHYISAYNKQPNEESYIELAELLIGKNQLSEAAIELKKALNLSPENPRIYRLLGQIELKKRIKVEALSHLQKCQQKDPQNYEAIFTIGALKQANEQIQSAMEYYQKAYSLSPNSAALWNNIAANMIAKKKTIVAYCCLKRALFLDPFKWNIHVNMGLVLIKVSKYVEAQMHLRSALRLQKDPLVYNLLGLCLSELGDLNNAQKSFLEGCSMDDSSCQYNYTCLLLKRGQKQKAEQYYKILLQKVLPPQIAEKMERISASL